MRSFRFLLSRRWVLFLLAILVVGYATWWLGQWQFHRLDEKKADNAVVRVNEGIDPTPVGEVLTPGTEVSEADEWRVVTATGTYDASKTVVVRYRTRDGESGVDIVVPLVTTDGTTLLVDRGWMATENAGTRPDDIPAPPAGEVEVSGWVRADGTGSSTQVDDLSVRAVASGPIGEAIGRPVYAGWVELRSESPEPTAALVPVELPELNNGPHFFYGLQWWFFGVLAIGGFVYLAWDERRNGRRRDRREAEAAATPARPVRPARQAATPAGRERAARKDARKAAIEAGLAKARAEKEARRAAAGKGPSQRTP